MKTPTMHIVTLMDYTDNTHVLMCKVWIYLVKRFHKHADVTVFYSKNIHPDIQEFANNYTNIYFKKLPKPTPYIKSFTGDNRPWTHSKLLIWKATEKHNISPYIFLDADAFVVQQIKTLWRSIQSKNFIAVAERNVNNVKICNSGVYAYNNIHKEITYSKLIHQYQKDNTIPLPTADQGILNAFLKENDIQYEHPDISHSYNCLTKNCIIKYIDDKNIHILSGKLSNLTRLYHKIQKTEDAWWVEWLGWAQPYHKICILHGFGYGMKFWELSESLPLWTYCTDKVHDIESKKES